MHSLTRAVVCLLMVVNVPAYAQVGDTLEYAGRETKFFGDYYVSEGEVSRDNIRVFGGDLFVAGQVDGQMTVLGGDVTLEPTAVVNGRIVAIGGSVSKKKGAVVNGQVVEATYGRASPIRMAPSRRENPGIENLD